MASKKSRKKEKVGKKRLFKKKFHQKSAKISPETVARVARIARLYLSDAEMKKFGKDLNEILKAFKELDKANTRSAEPSFQPLLVKDVFREDATEKCISNDEALKNTKHKEKKFFKGPRAV